MFSTKYLKVFLTSLEGYTFDSLIGRSLQILIKGYLFSVSLFIILYVVVDPLDKLTLFTTKITVSSVYIYIYIYIYRV